jgi:hypothetical protein
VGTQQYDAIDLTGLRRDARVSGGSSAHAPAYYRNALRAILSEIPYCRQQIQVKRRIHWVRIAWTTRLAVTPEVQRQHLKSCRHQSFSLLRPTLFVETASMRKHDRSVTRSVNIGENDPAIFGRKGNRILCSRNLHKEQS